MLDFIVHSITFTVWMVYTFPPLVASKNKAALIARTIVAAVLGGCIGFGFGQAIAEVIR